MSEPTAYELYRSGIDLLEQRDHHAAALPLRRARDLEPTTAMVREALGRALFGSQRYREAAEEFGVLVELEPVNHYAQFCLGRALQLQGLHTEARPPLTMAALLQPERADYRVYRDRTIAAIESGGGSARAEGGGDGPAATLSDGDGSTSADPGDPSGDAAPPPGSRRSGAGPWGAPAGEPDARFAGAGGPDPDHEEDRRDREDRRDDGDHVDPGDRGRAATELGGPTGTAADGTAAGGDAAGGETAATGPPEDLGGPPPRA